MEGGQGQQQGQIQAGGRVPHTSPQQEPGPAGQDQPQGQAGQPQARDELDVHVVRGLEDFGVLVAVAAKPGGRRGQEHRIMPGVALVAQAKDRAFSGDEQARAEQRRPGRVRKIAHPFLEQGVYRPADGGQLLARSPKGQADHQRPAHGQGRQMPPGTAQAQHGPAPEIEPHGGGEGQAAGDPAGPGQGQDQRAGHKGQAGRAKTPGRFRGPGQGDQGIGRGHGQILGIPARIGEDRGEAVMKQIVVAPEMQSQTVDDGDDQAGQDARGQGLEAPGPGGSGQLTNEHGKDGQPGRRAQAVSRDVGRGKGHGGEKGGRPEKGQLRGQAVPGQKQRGPQGQDGQRAEKRPARTGGGPGLRCALGLVLAEIAPAQGQGGHVQDQTEGGRRIDVGLPAEEKKRRAQEKKPHGQPPARHGQSQAPDHDHGRERLGRPTQPGQHGHRQQAMAGGQGQTAGPQRAGKKLSQGRAHGLGRSRVVRADAATQWWSCIMAFS